MKKTVLIINEQHTLLPQQEEAISNAGLEITTILRVPATGWTASEQIEIAANWSAEHGKSVPLFVSPVPVLLATLARRRHVRIMHNDRREKKELPNGKIIFTVAQDGWEVV